MKKLLALLLAVVMVACLFAGCTPSDGEGTGSTNPSGNTNTQTGKYKVAMITDYGDITDQSFNQTTYEAVKAFCETNSLTYKYFKPESDSTDARIAMVDAAVADGYNVIVMPGYAFAGTIAGVQDEYESVKFIALDVSAFDLEDAFYNHDESGNRTTLIDENNKPHQGSNVYCAVYQEELAGYMAGYAAVKLGYKHLGFLGGMAVPAVIRFGYGFVQGVNAAAVEMGIADQVAVEYVYGNQFYGDADITAYMDNWYQNLGVEAVFACGGGIYTSAAEAAAKVGGKVIGVDTDQSGNINRDYGEGMTITSAMKGLAATVNTLLSEVVAGNFANYGGKIVTMGLVDADPTKNYVQIPAETTQWSDAYTYENYVELVGKMLNGEVVVSGAIDALPSVTVKVNEYGNIK